MPDLTKPPSPILQNDIPQWINCSQHSDCFKPWGAIPAATTPYE